MKLLFFKVEIQLYSIIPISKDIFSVEILTLQFLIYRTQDFGNKNE